MGKMLTWIKQTFLCKKLSEKRKCARIWEWLLKRVRSTDIEEAQDQEAIIKSLKMWHEKPDDQKGAKLATPTAKPVFDQKTLDGIEYLEKTSTGPFCKLRSMLGNWKRDSGLTPRFNYNDMQFNTSNSKQDGMNQSEDALNHSQSSELQS
jgi:hypothetical protein